MTSVFFAYLNSALAWILGLSISFLKVVVLFLILTIVIATVTLIERKILALTQRRVGPNYIGYKGRLQFFADALKLLLKHITILTKVNKFFFIIIPVAVCTIIYLFWANIVWASDLAIFDIEYNILLMSLLSTFCSYLLVLVGYASNNKYAMISSTRVLVIGLNLELLLMFLMLMLGMMCENLSFWALITTQGQGQWNIFMTIPVWPIMVITFFLETARIPFDFTEAEAELIAGYTTEFGGFYFALFYLGEYFHLYCFSAIYALCLFGG